VATHDFEPTNFHVTIGSHEPVLRVASGDTVRTWCVDSGGSDHSETQITDGGNPQTGPFFVEGAAPGDTLAVKILELTVDSNQGVGALAPGFGALNTTSYTPMLHAPVPEKIWFYPIDRAKNEATFTRSTRSSRRRSRCIRSWAASAWRRGSSRAAR
jgi:Predicted acetamidase/formamidase